MAHNYKKDAIKGVLTALQKAKEDIHSTPTKPKGSKAGTMVFGLGRGGHLWQSSLAETVRTDLVGPIDAIMKKVLETVDEVKEKESKQPENVTFTDGRALW